MIGFTRHQCRDDGPITIRMIIPGHSGVGYAGVGGQRGFNFAGFYPRAANFQLIVKPTVIQKIP